MHRLGIPAQYDILTLFSLSTASIDGCFFSIASFNAVVSLFLFDVEINLLLPFCRAEFRTQGTENRQQLPKNREHIIYELAILDFFGQLQSRRRTNYTQPQHIL